MFLFHASFFLDVVFKRKKSTEKRDVGGRKLRLTHGYLSKKSKTKMTSLIMI